MMSDSVSMTKIRPISGSTRIWPVMRAMTASVAPSDSDPASPMMICAGWTLNHRKPSSAPMISAHRSAIWGWAGTLSSAMIRNETNANASVPPDEAVEAVGDVDAVRRRRRSRTPRTRRRRAGRSATSPTNGTRMPVIWYVLWICYATNSATTDLPQQLLAGADPLARPGVEVVVDGAEQADERERARSGR